MQALATRAEASLGTGVQHLMQWDRKQAGWLQTYQVLSLTEHEAEQDGCTAAKHSYQNTPGRTTGFLLTFVQPVKVF